MRPCPRHPGMAATMFCSGCGKAVCATCDFSFEDGEVHLCPDCAVEPAPAGVASGRKTVVIASYVLALWGTVALPLLVALARTSRRTDAEALGMMLLFLVLAPALLGTGLGLSATERRLPNPGWLVGAWIWNAVVVALFLLLMVVGLTR
jgi:hypothetical protein